MACRDKQRLLTEYQATNTLGDILAEWLVFLIPAVAIWFGWHNLFSEKMFAVWIVGYIFADAFGIVFQYFTIAPMRGLSFGQGKTPGGARVLHDEDHKHIEQSAFAAGRIDPLCSHYIHRVC